MSSPLNKFLRKKMGKVRRSCAVSGCLVHCSMRVKLSKFPRPNSVRLGWSIFPKKEKRPERTGENRPTKTK